MCVYVCESECVCGEVLCMNWGGGGGGGRRKKEDGDKEHWESETD